MANFVITTEKVTINAVDMSAMCTSAGLQITVEDKDTTAFGTSGWRTFVGGLKTSSVATNFNQDFASAQVDALLWPLLGTVVTCNLRPTSSAIGSLNPEYQGNVLIAGYSPIGGAVGDLATTQATWPGSGVWTRATS